MNLIGAAAVASSIVAFAACYHRLRSSSAVVRAVSFFGFAVLSIPALLFAIYYLHVMPEQAWLYALRSWSGTEFLVIFLGCAGGAAASLLPRLLLGLPLCGVLAVAIAPYIKPIIGALPDSVFEDRWQGGACLQSTPSTCGPASVSTILRQLGVITTEHEVARAAYSYSGGTEAWYLARYIRHQGLAPRFVFRSTFSPAVGQPALVGVRLGGAGHFIAVLDVRDGLVTFADPLHGIQHLPLQKFLRRYEFTGFHMVVERD